ncbi:hypothetical protein N0V90_002036 [Kalmusia sp. IMI 367209]|nr:hypothetical protein N0V90_002036 [Kalmusia sp. IMI 367209]
MILKNGLNKTLNESTPTRGPSDHESWDEYSAWLSEWTVDDDLNYYDRDGRSGLPYYISVFGSVPANGSGEILSWNGYKYRSRDDAKTVMYIGLIRPETHFSVCDFWNASVAFTVDITRGNARVSTDEPHYINLVDLNNVDRGGYYNFSSIAYANFFNEGSEYITGMIEQMYDHHSSWDNITTRAQDTYLSINIQWARMMHNFTSDIHDKFDETLLRNKTFAEDVEFFFLRASMSLLHDPTLCELVATNVTSHKLLTIYIYRPANLIIAYGISIFLCAGSVIVGMYAFWINGVAYDTKLTTFGVAMQQPEIKGALLDHNMYEAKKHRNEHGKLQVKFVATQGFLLAVNR